MIKKWISLLFISLLFTAFSIPERIEKKADKEIAKYFNTENFSKEDILEMHQVKQLHSII